MRLIMKLKQLLLFVPYLQHASILIQRCGTWDSLPRATRPGDVHTACLHVPATSVVTGLQ